METVSTAIARLASGSTEGRRRTQRLLPRICGRSVFELHEAVWKSLGGQILDLGSTTRIDPTAKFYVLQDGRLLTIPHTMEWLRRVRRPESIACVRIANSRPLGYREHCHVDGDGRFTRFSRHYESRVLLRHRLGITSSQELARIWQQHADATEAWREIRRVTGKGNRAVVTASGLLFNWMESADVTAFAIELARRSPEVAADVCGMTKLGDGIFASESSRVDPQARIVGPVWIGFNRQVGADDCLVGPAVLWDREGTSSPNGDARAETRRAEESAPRPAPSTTHWRRPVRSRLGYRIAKRTFDVAFAMIALAITVPLYPLIALAIWIEDGWPIFFSHRRETTGGREFGCLKFRSMRRDAEEIRKRIGDQNLCDGPQFFIDNDPRMTRVGRLIRDSQIDEWPQFWHVLSGRMSVVGPRPLPRAENQYCPQWREARLSVPPGITGLWQIRRSRKAGEDFQEWIRFDIDYVERASFRLDLWILLHTIGHMFRLIYLRTLGQPRAGAPEAEESKDSPLAVPTAG